MMMSLDVPSTKHLRKSQLTMAVNIAALSIGALGLAGMIFQIPLLYKWTASGIAMSFYTALSFILLIVGYGLHIYFPASKNALLNKIIPSVCFSVAFFIGLAEIISFWRAEGRFTLEEYLLPGNPFEGHISFYGAIGLLLAAASSFLLVLSSTLPRWSFTITQLLILLLINISAFGFAESVGFHPLFRLLMSIPSSLGLFFYGVALLLFPAHELHLSSPFFSSRPLIRGYTVLLCVGWIAVVFWQATWANNYLGEFDLTIATVHSMLVIDELFEIMLTSFILGFGLHALGTLEKNLRLNQALSRVARKLRDAFDRSSLIAAALSHDLKVPMQTQMSILQAMRQGHYGERIADEKNQSMFAALLENSHFQLALVMNLIDLLRAQIQEEQLNLWPIKINPFLSEIKQELEPLVLEKEQTLCIHPLPTEEQIIADYRGLKRILHNLIFNAIQHLQKGDRIDVEVKPQEKELVFAVKDTGPGIGEDIQRKIFQSFIEVGSLTEFSSHGLGLYITKQIVDRHGGNIWVESAPERGSTFYFTLPRQLT